MNKPICDACGGAILNPKSVIKLDEAETPSGTINHITLCLSCYESERQSTPQFPTDYEEC